MSMAAMTGGATFFSEWRCVRWKLSNYGGKAVGGDVGGLSVGFR
jgi:hypothetical protein